MEVLDRKKEARSRFRVPRIPLTFAQIPHYYGLAISDDEEEEKDEKEVPQKRNWVRKSISAAPLIAPVPLLPPVPEKRKPKQSEGPSKTRMVMNAVILEEQTIFESSLTEGSSFRRLRKSQSSGGHLPEVKHASKMRQSSVFDAPPAKTFFNKPETIELAMRGASTKERATEKQLLTTAKEPDNDLKDESPPPRKFRLVDYSLSEGSLVNTSRDISMDFVVPSKKKDLSPKKPEKVKKVQFVDLSIHDISSDDEPMDVVIEPKAPLKNLRRSTRIVTSHFASSLQDTLPSKKEPAKKVKAVEPKPKEEPAKKVKAVEPKPQKSNDIAIEPKAPLQDLRRSARRRTMRFASSLQDTLPIKKEPVKKVKAVEPKPKKEPVKKINAETDGSKSKAKTTKPTEPPSSLKNTYELRSSRH